MTIIPELKTIGLLGGMSWESTAVYYQILNRTVQSRLGGLHSAKILLHSLDFAEVVALQRQDNWAGAADLLGQAGRGLAQAGADVIAICTNTMHKVAPSVQDQLSVPLLHIADTTRAAVCAAGFNVVGLLGTRYTMEQDFLRRRLSAGGPKVLVPAGSELSLVHDIIFSELCLGQTRHTSRVALLQIMEGLEERGAQAIILGCTELMLLLRQSDCELPLLDTTTLHADALAQFALSEFTPAAADTAVWKREPALS